MNSTKTRCRGEPRNGYGRDDGAVDPLLADLTSECESLSASLVNPDALAVLLDQTRDEMYTDSRYRSIRESIEAVHNAGRNVDAVSVADDLRRRGTLDDIGGEPFLIELLDGVPRWWQAGSNAERIIECWRRRRVHQTATAIREAAESPVTDLSVLGEIESKLGIESDKPSELFPLLSAAELDSNKFDTEWLVEDLLVSGQFGVIGGPSKTLKTSLSLSLALKLATGGHWLDRYRIPKPKRVLMMSGESGLSTLQETSRRIADSMGWSLGQIEGFYLTDRVASLDNPEHLRTLKRIIVTEGIEVVFSDCLYLQLGDAGDSGSNVFKMGSLLSGFSRIGQETGATVLVLHHSTKSLADPYKPMKLGSLAFAGINENARQWLLVNRREEYREEDPGKHSLWMSFGGSAGHSGLIGIDVDESPNERGRRQWIVETCSPEQAYSRGEELSEERKQLSKQRKQSASYQANRQALMLALQESDGPLTFTKLRNATGLHTGTARDILDELIESGQVEESDIKGKNSHSYKAYQWVETTGEKPFSPMGKQSSPMTGSIGEDNPPLIGGCPRSPMDRSDSSPMKSSPMDGYEFDPADLPTDPFRSEVTASGEPASGEDF